MSRDAWQDRRVSSSAPLVAPSRRRLAVLVIAFAAAGVATLGVWLHDRRSTGVDHSITHFLAVHLSSSQTAVFLLGFSEPALALGVCAVVAGAAALARRWNVVLLAVAGPLIAVGLTELALKPLVHRTLGGSTYEGVHYPIADAYPSGHETGLCALTAVLALLVLRTRWSKAGKVVLTTLLAVWTLVGAVGLIRNYYHYPTDTLGALGVSIASVVATALVIDRGIERRRRVSGRDAPGRPRTARAA